MEVPSKHQCLTRACLSAACCNKLQAPPLGGQRRCNGHVAGDYWARPARGPCPCLVASSSAAEAEASAQSRGNCNPHSTRRGQRGCDQAAPRPRATAEKMQTPEFCSCSVSNLGPVSNLGEHHLFVKQDGPIFQSELEAVSVSRHPGHSERRI